MTSSAGPGAVGGSAFTCGSTRAIWLTETSRGSARLPSRGPARVVVRWRRRIEKTTLVATLATRAGLLVMPEQQRDATLDRIRSGRCRGAARSTAAARFGDVAALAASDS